MGLVNNAISKADYQVILEYFQNVIKGGKYENHVFVVGGCERDYIINENFIKDIDIVVDLPNGGIEFAKWLESENLTEGSLVVYEKYGTVMFRLKEFPEIEFEAVQTRKECYRDINTRNPETAFGTIEEDASRRDFTINAIYRNISTDEVLDINGKSFSDIDEKIIRTCGEPDIIFKEDPLRIMRAVRFLYRFRDFKIEENTLKGIIDNAYRLAIVSQERITEEFSKILLGPNVNEALLSMNTWGISQYLWPNIGIKTNLHSFSGLVVFPRLLYCRLAYVFSHISDEKAEEILQAMKFPNIIIKETLWYKDNLSISWTPYDSKNSLYHLRKFLYDAGNELKVLNVLNIWERIHNINYHSYVDWIKKNEGFEFCSYRLPVDGNDILSYCNLEPGPIVKQILSHLLDKAFENPKITKEECLAEAKKFLEEQ